MKSVLSARYLTFGYFSLVALALVLIHVSVFWQTKEDLERLYGQNRLDQIKAHAAERFANVDVGDRPGIHIAPVNPSDLDQGTDIVFDFSRLPRWLPSPDTLRPDEGVEALSSDGEEAYFLMKTTLPTATGPREAVLLMDFRLYEMSESQMLASHMKQIIVSIVLLLAVMIVVMMISGRLTRPISRFAATLAQKKTEDLAPVPLPPGTATRELVEMVDTFNLYLERIRTLLERERSFSRYASHELRTPLTVMRGALTLLEESDDPEFAARQRGRLNDALIEMSELIETLLNLTSTEDGGPSEERVLTTTELEYIAREHEYLLAGKALSWRVAIRDEPVIRMPPATFRVLLGNLVRNAFSYAERGEVMIEARPGRISVSDAGASHADDAHIQEGFGLGLLLVRDICHRHGWRIEHWGNDRGGWTSIIEY